MRELTEEVKVRYNWLKGAFRALNESGHSVMDINATAMGMVRKSMEVEVGVEKAAEMDKEARLKIGWPY